MLPCSHMAAMPGGGPAPGPPAVMPEVGSGPKAKGPPRGRPCMAAVAAPAAAPGAAEAEPGLYAPCCCCCGGGGGCCFGSEGTMSSVRSAGRAMLVLCRASAPGPPVVAPLPGTSSVGCRSEARRGTMAGGGGPEEEELGPMPATALAGGPGLEPTWRSKPTGLEPAPGAGSVGMVVVPVPTGTRAGTGAFNTGSSRESTAAAAGAAAGDQLADDAPEPAEAAALAGRRPDAAEG